MPASPGPAASIGIVTVAAVVLAARPESALKDADGLPRVRRIVDSAWSGGAVPIIAVSADPEGAIAAALAGSEAVLAEPVPLPEGLPVAQIRRGIEVALDTVRGVDAALVWPARMGWVGPETVTSLIEAHGVDRRTILRPGYAGEAGWPVLVPTSALAAMAGLAPDRMPDQLIDDLVAAGIGCRTIELGDPGTTHDGSVPRDQLPPYLGPDEPAAAHSHEWGAALADESEETPLEGPALAPYGQAEED
jgi:CTP:molybdopterin cytidylyltransferase MocA